MPGGDVVLHDLYWDSAVQRPLMVLTVPVPGQGAFVLEIDPETFLFPAIRSWPGPRSTAEAVLVRREGNDVFYLSGAATPTPSPFFLRKLPWGIQYPPDAALDSGWFSAGFDYCGVAVLQSVRRIPDSPWYLAAKIDATEVYAPLRRLGWEMALIAALVAALNAAGIARELHDDLSQQIAALSIALSNLKKGIPAERTDHSPAERANPGKAVQMAEAVRRLSHELHPAILQHAGLAAALNSYCAELRELTGIQVSLRTDSSFTGVPEPVALSIYRVAQGAVQNAVKHAKAAEIAVTLQRSGGILSLVVSDTGVGMSLQPDGSAMGLGLISMKERARLAGGSIEIRSRPDQGTTLTLRVPDGAAPIRDTIRLP